MNDRFIVFVLVILAVGTFVPVSPANAGELSALFGQLDDAIDNLALDDDGRGRPILDSWLVKVAFLLSAFIGAMLFFFLSIFPLLLRMNKPWWPLPAYGLCMSLALTVTFAVALWLFWNDLLIGDAVPARTWWEAWSGRMAVIAAWLFAVLIVHAVCRSPHARKSPKAA